MSPSPLSNLDSAFLHLESADAPMHVGGILRFGQPADGPMTFARFRRHVACRLQTAPVFRQRLHQPPRLVDNPVWIEDARFDLDNHLHPRVVDGALDGAVGRLANAFFAGCLRRDRPLWEMLYVESEDPAEGFAVLLKVHHAALDGVSAEAVVSGLLDATVTPRELPADTWAPEDAPSAGATLGHRARDLRSAPATWKTLVGTATKLAAKRLTATKFRRLPNYFTAPRTPLNTAVSAGRRYAAVQLPLAQVKAIRAAVPGATINDVALAICGGATRRYLLEEGELPDASLVALAPVSRRAKEEGHGGNKVAAMLIRLATDVSDPLRRLEYIHENVALAKEYNREVPFDVLLEMLPKALPAAALSAFNRLHIAQRLPPIFNLVVTNVPGPQVPMYLDSAPLKGISGMVGVYDGMGLGFVVMSYCDQLSIGLTSCDTALKDPQRMMRLLEEESERLAWAVQSRQNAGALRPAPTLKPLPGKPAGKRRAAR